ncbi:MAG: hypothetical protein QOH90_1055, partial [Actinomycetota bacterium]|nr:hypothetical protein [Actinomycetota bacterium]
MTIARVAMVVNGFKDRATDLGSSIETFLRDR